MKSSSHVILLGPQRLKPTLGAAVRTLGLDGRIATITAGWQEREADDQELHYHLDGRSINLRLYQRAEELFENDPEFAEAHRARQETLQRLQELYELRLAHALEAVIELFRRPDKSALLDEERGEALEAVRTLDARHLARVAEVHAAFEERWKPTEREEIARERQRLSEILCWTPALAIAGGHVAVLLNRLRLFDIAGLLTGQPIIAWSAGAMAIGQRVVLFHDNPPQGPGHASVLDVGLGLCKGVVPLPHAWRRLKLEDVGRVSRLVRRFHPDLCIALADGGKLEWDGKKWHGDEGAHRLRKDGRLEVMAA
ncbi:MAG: Type 1 glutamine amidotransferase-like domain-containing protein [Candidatus Eisenbacteria bacterium]|nr:Type 1 glutamine amidotransferase-like domain-containing protein [Candidatus Eisenbacteria bacterium]MCC7141634.1 Type 1 glutamine amidotransferase-like domain-containing protein [Candidatus Eisenbacteria bacterium]